MGCYRPVLDALYERYNRAEFLSPDPVELVRPYEDPADREVAGLIASSLAYGRAAMIVRSVTRVLSKMGSSPAGFVRESGAERFEKLFGNFRHRFTDGRDISALLLGTGAVLAEWGTLENCFYHALEPDAPDTVQALSFLVDCLGAPSDGRKNSLLPSPGAGSACKRFHLFLKWMVRADAVDPGGWSRVPRSKLLIPLDTHMGRIARSLEMTSRKQDDLRTAREVTAAFRMIAPEDPTRYDFVLTRFGIRADLEVDQLFRFCRDGSPELVAGDRSGYTRGDS